VVVLRVCLEVLREVIDALAEESDLDFRGSRVRLVSAITAYDFGLSFLVQGHVLTSTNGPEGASPRLTEAAAHCDVPLMCEDSTF
jgi:hypothetical protein